MMEVVVTTGAISRAKLQSNHYHQQTNTKSFFTGRMPFLSPNQQCQSTEGKEFLNNSKLNNLQQQRLSENWITTIQLRDLKQILEDVRHIVHLSTHEVFARGRQLGRERFQCWIDGLQRRGKAGETSNFKARIHQSVEQDICSCIRLNTTCLPNCRYCYSY